MMDFTLWLEFEHLAQPADWDMTNDLCNIHVDFADGRHYGINVWTYDFLKTAVQADKAQGKNLQGSYLIPPDLFVKELSRECIEATIIDLLQVGDLEQVLNLSVRAV
jgi:hypothetical protein